MDRTELISRLKATETELRASGVSHLFLFGSYSRGDQGPQSDVDIFVDKQPGHSFGFEELTGSYRVLQGALPGLPISFGTREGLSRHIRRIVEREAVQIF